MTKHVTTELNESEVARAHSGRPIGAHLPFEVPENQRKALLRKIIDLGSAADPTDIAKDKDRLIGEAVWDEHLRETKQEKMTVFVDTSAWFAAANAKDLSPDFEVLR